MDDKTLQDQESRARVIMNTKMQAAGDELKRMVDVVAEGIAVKHNLRIQTQLTVKMAPKIEIDKG